MARNVLVTIESIRKHTDNVKEEITYQCQGTMHQKNDYIYIIYQEPEQSGMGNVSTTLKVEGSKITIIRNGHVNMRQVFEKGVLHRSNYQSTVGTMEMAIKPWYIQVHLTDIGGSIKLEYELALDGAPVGTTSLEMTIRVI